MLVSGAAPQPAAESAEPGRDEFTADGQPGPGGCPYPGLSGFDAASERWFFGRERMVTELVARVAGRLRDGGPLVLVGASGSGKSSLLRAGLLPALARGEVSGPQVLITPGERPLARLLDGLAAAGVPVAASLTGDVVGTPDLADRLRALVVSRPGADRLVVAVDQFEETFTLCDDPSQREMFIRTLCAVAADRGGTGPAALVVIGLRADFYARCAAHPELVEALQSGQVVVGPMTAVEIRDIVVRPAGACGVDVEPGLVEVVLRDLGAAPTSAGVSPGGAAVITDPGSLPLLAHALRSTWFARDAADLTVASYLRAGGLTGAIAQTAEGAYTALDAGAQQAVRPLLMRMIRLGEAEQDTRRRVRRADLLTVVPTPQAAAALDTLVAARLVAADADGDRDSLQIAHEALLRSWPRLRSWMDVDRASAVALQTLNDAAETWDVGGRDRSYLFGGTRLAAAREWIEAQPGEAALSASARDFYAESLRAEQVERQTGIRRTRRLHRLVAALAVLVLAAASLAGLAYQQKSTASAARDRALSQRIASQADAARDRNPAIAAQLSLVAYHTAATPEARGSVLSSFNGGAGVPTRYLFHRGSVGAVGYSPNGKLIATGSDDWSTAIWDAAHPDRSTPLAVLPGPRAGGHTRAVKAVAFSRDSKLLATGSSDRTAKIWDVSTPSRPRLLVTLPPTTTDVYGLAFSPVADRLAVSGYGNSAQIYDVSDPAHPRPQGALLVNGRPFHLAPIDALAFSPDGDFIAAGDLGASTLLWYVGPLTRIGPVAVLNDTAAVQAGELLAGDVRAVAFGSDGRSVYTAGASGRIKVFTGPSLLHLTLSATLGIGNDPMTTLAVAPDGLVAAAGNLFEGPALYDPATTRQRSLLTDPTERARPVTLLDQGTVTWSVAFSPDGRHLATGAADGALRVWEIPGPALLTRHGDQLAGEVNPRTDQVVTMNYSVVELWNISNPYNPVHLSVVSDANADDNDFVAAAGLDPSGRTLAVGTSKRVRLYDVTDPTRPALLSTFSGPPGGTFSLRFSPDGRTLALGALDSPPAPAYTTTLEAWDVRDPRNPARLASVIAHRADIRDIKFSRDGRLMASVADTVRLWDVSDPHRIVARGNIPGLPGRAGRVAFSPDGRTLAVGSEGGAHATLWNITEASRPSLVASLPGHVSQVNSLEFSADGHTLVTGSNDDSVRLWDVRRPAHPILLERMSRSTTSNTSGIATVAFSRDNSTLVGVLLSEPGALWDLDVDRVAKRVCAQAGVGITREEWAQYLPDLAYDPPCV